MIASRTLTKKGLKKHKTGLTAHPCFLASRTLTKKGLKWERSDRGGRSNRPCESHPDEEGIEGRYVYSLLVQNTVLRVAP